MKIGIGVTTYNRPHLNSLWDTIECYIDERDSEGVDIHLFRAINITGIATAKNECIKVLSYCDYIFLLDDDCFLNLNTEWINFFIEAHQRTGQHHFSYMRDGVDIVKKINEFDGIEVFNNCKGCFMSFTKECIEKVGLFNEGFGLYGFEHAEYSQRVYKAGLNKYPYMSVKGSSEYIYSLDFDFKSSLTDQEKQTAIDNSLPVFQKYLNENTL